MEEADLLKERLQAITDKRRIQEDIAKKRRQIEEEKLQLQYIKKKVLREQWLMDGLSQQSEQEAEAMRLQAQDEQQQSDQLQSNILSIEEEIQSLEAQELHISENEEVILKRLKEVERTAEDIIKELNEYQADVTHHVCSSLLDIPSFLSLIPAETRPICNTGSEGKKKATFAMEINVEHNKTTGKNQVVSTASITPKAIQGRGLKVFDDGHKSVYALHPDGGKMHSGAIGEMTTTEVDDLLCQATDSKMPTNVQYHQPVFSAPYKGSSGQTASSSPSQRPNSSGNRAQLLTEENQHRKDLENPTTHSKTHRSDIIQQDSVSRVHECGGENQLPYFHIPGRSKADKLPVPKTGVKTPGMTDASSLKPAALVSVTSRCEGMPAPRPPVYRPVKSLKSDSDTDTMIKSSGDFRSKSPSLNLIDTLSEELESAPVTMIFMGYENAEEEEEEDIHAELVVIPNSDDEEEAKCVENESEREGSLSYHPEGYTSKVFQPKMGVAKVKGCGDVIEDACTHWDDLELHKPTFIHKPGKHSPYMEERGVDESASAGSINMEKMKLCSTGR